MLDLDYNKSKFISLLKEIDRPNSDIEGLIYHLCNKSDFFEAPCSTKFHLCEDGGLCKHSLNVFEELNKLCDIYAPHISRTSRIIVALCHDLSKSNYYDKCFKSVKKYSETGLKRDEGGKFDWVTESYFTIRDAEKRFLLGDHGKNSEYITSTYIPLTLEESAAIINHMGSVMDEYRPWDMTPIYNRYPMASLLHMADFIATYIIERNSQ